MPTLDAQPVQRMEDAVSVAVAPGPMDAATRRAVCCGSGCLPGAFMSVRPAPYIVIHLRSIQSLTGHTQAPWQSQTAHMTKLKYGSATHRHGLWQTQTVWNA